MIKGTQPTSGETDPLKTRPRVFLIASLLGIALLGSAATPADAAPTTMVDLGAASPYAVLSGPSVGNTVSAPGAPHTTIRGDLGIKADTAPLGFPPGVVTGTIRHGSSVDQAHADAVSAYTEMANRSGGVVIPGALAGAVILPGLYTIVGASSNTGTLTLDGGGDPEAVFVFQVDGALSFAALSHVLLTNGARASRVFWQINGAGALGAGSDFAGTMIASAAVGVGNGTLLNGRAIALAGALTLDNNQFYGAPPVVTITGGGTAYTTDTTPTLAGTTDVDAPGVVTVTIAGQVFTATPVSGTWSVTSGLLANGSYPVEASVMDAAGNPGEAFQELIVDTVLPEIALDGGAEMMTGSVTPTISGTSDVAVDTVVRVTIHSTVLKALVHSDGSWNIRAAALPPGTYPVTASVSDPAGNESISTQSITIDTTPPAVTFAGGSDARTNDATPTLNGFANVAPGTLVKVFVANQTLTGVVDNDQLWSVTAAALPNGVHRFMLEIFDAAGNRAWVEHLLTIDATVPPVAVDKEAPTIRGLAVTPRKVSLNGGSKSAINRLGPLISLTLKEAAMIQFSLNGKGFRAKSFQSQRGGGASFGRIPKPIRKRLGRGSYQITATATDAIGQVSEARQTSFRVIR